MKLSDLVVDDVILCRGSAYIVEALWEPVASVKLLLNAPDGEYICYRFRNQEDGSSLAGAGSRDEDYVMCKSARWTKTGRYVVVDCLGRFFARRGKWSEDLSEGRLYRTRSSAIKTLERICTGDDCGCPSDAACCRVQLVDLTLRTGHETSHNLRAHARRY